MIKNDMYNPNQPSYESSPMGYELPGSLIRAYSSGGNSEGSGVITAPTLHIMP